MDSESFLESEIRWTISEPESELGTGYRSISVPALEEITLSMTSDSVFPSDVASLSISVLVLLKSSLTDFL